MWVEEIERARLGCSHGDSGRQVQRRAASSRAAIKADARNPWAYYNRADALAGLNRVDESVAAFREAERRFSPADMYGKSIADYGRANVLDQAGRCEEARKAFAEYAAFIRTDDPKSAAMADRFADECTARPPHCRRHDRRPNATRQMRGSRRPVPGNRP